MRRRRSGPSLLATLFAYLLGAHLLGVAGSKPDRANEAEPVVAGGDVQAPVLVSRVEPEYPKKAREAGITGTVVLDTVVSTEGRVTRVKVVKSLPLLDHAAIEAIQQWRYKPATKDGRPVETSLSIAVSFPPAGGVAAPSQREEIGEIYDVTGDVTPPKLVTRVTPEYPKEAHRAKVGGRVILNAIIGVDGNIESVAVKRSAPMFDEPAVAAVKQWKYEPATKGGRPVRVRFLIVVDFSNN